MSFWISYSDKGETIKNAFKGTLLASKVLVVFSMFKPVYSSSFFVWLLTHIARAHIGSFA